MKNILIVDNDPIMLYTLGGLLKSHINVLRILSAVSMRSALKILESKEVHLLITGMHMSEMDTFKLLSLFESDYPEIKAIVITHNASSMFRNNIKQMPAVIAFNQAIEISLLTKRILTELQIDFGGQLRGITITSILQMLELEELSCTLLVTAKGKVGTIYIARGKPTAAKMGWLMGKPAILQILTWQNVLIDIDYVPRDVPQEIDMSLMNLLLESGQIMDEKRSQRFNMRKHIRYDCLVGVEYNISNWNYQCYMRDISEGGAYIETEQPVRVGQQLMVSLFSPALEQSSDINGEVVRRDTKGFGVRFGELTLKQKQVIRSLIESHCAPIPEPSKLAIR